MKNTITASQPEVANQPIAKISSKDFDLGIDPPMKACDLHSNSTPCPDRVYIGIDQHADSLVVVQQINACVPKRARKFTDKHELFTLIREHQATGAFVFVAYEAGPCGYWLSRQLTEMDVTTTVVAPKKWSENGKVKTDAKDARVLCERLSRFENGSEHEFTPVMVPTIPQEDQRGLVRVRERLLKVRKSLAQSGRGIGLLREMRLKGAWWKGSLWDEVASGLAPLLGPIRETLLTLEKVIDHLSTKIEALAAEPETLPYGLGKLTDAVISAEVMDFTRFKNRNQPGSFCGLVPGEDTTGGRRKSLPITKAGPGILRRFLVEAAWRMKRFQPDWHAWKKVKASFEDAAGWRRKQLIVGLARQLLVDLWRLRTGQTTMKRLGWIAAV